MCSLFIVQSLSRVPAYFSILETKAASFKSSSAGFSPLLYSLSCWVSLAKPASANCPTKKKRLEKNASIFDAGRVLTVFSTVCRHCLIPSLWSKGSCAHLLGNDSDVINDIQLGVLKVRSSKAPCRRIKNGPDNLVAARWLNLAAWDRLSIQVTVPDVVSCKGVNLFIVEGINVIVDSFLHRTLVCSLQGSYAIRVGSSLQLFFSVSVMRGS